MQDRTRAIRQTCSPDSSEVNDRDSYLFDDLDMRVRGLNEALDQDIIDSTEKPVSPASAAGVARPDASRTHYEQR